MAQKICKSWEPPPPLGQSFPRWGTQKGEVAFATFNICVRWSVPKCEMRVYRNRNWENLSERRIWWKIIYTLLIFRLFLLLVRFQLHVAAVHILYVSEEWTEVLLLLSSEHLAESSMDTDWVSRAGKVTKETLLKGGTAWSMNTFHSFILPVMREVLICLAAVY